MAIGEGFPWNNYVRTDSSSSYHVSELDYLHRTIARLREERDAYKQALAALFEREKLEALGFSSEEVNR